jgi:vacuolar-type H+-ATPase subunit F/Vma7
VTIAVVGSAEDVGGFALAGLPVFLAETGPEVEAALRLAADGPAPACFLLVSAGAARLVPEAVEALGKPEGAPVVLVLPATASP